MSCIGVLCWVDEENAGQMTELASVDMPEVDISTLEPETALDELEAPTYEQGQAILHRLLVAVGGD